MAPERRRLGILFQDVSGRSPSLGRRQSRLRAYPRGARPGGRQERIAAALARAGLAGFALRDPARPGAVSARAWPSCVFLLAEPLVLLLDEPFGKLDAALREEFQHFVFDHIKARGLPALLVTHDKADADAAGGRVLRLD